MHIPSGSGSYYTSGEDRIYLGASDVPGSYGTFVVPHEYGHAGHEKALGGNAASGTCSWHTLNAAINLKCAYSEGFADFHAAYTAGPILTSSFGSDYSIEHNSYYPGWIYNSQHQPVNQSSDGSIIEGAVAAFFYDLVDGPNEPDGASNQADGDDDAIQYSGKYVSDIVKTCKVDGSVRANGIDHLVYCFERQIDQESRIPASIS